jgi:hypothetical protein
MLHLCHLVPSPLWGRRGSQVEGWCGWLEYQGQEKHVLPLARKPARKLHARPMANFIKVYFFFLFMYYIQHCFICRPSDSTVLDLEDAGIEPRTVAYDYGIGCQTL